MTIGIFAGRRQPGKIAELELDATLNETHIYSNTVTDFPVESGSNISDHIKNDPVVLSMDGFITNAPVPILDLGVDNLKSSFQSLGQQVASKVVSRDKFERTSVALNLLQDYYKNGTVIDVRTGLKVYTSMVITRLQIPRSGASADNIQFSAEFKEIRFVQTKTIPLPNTADLNGKAPGVKDQAQNKNDTGKQPTKTVPEQSILKQIVIGTKQFLGK